jgi:hypothetical protein
MAGSRAPDVTTIPLGRASPRASSNQPERPSLRTGPASLAAARVAPIRSCSRRGLPCRRRCRRRGALLPHPFTLAGSELSPDAGGLLSVALSLGSPPPDVIRRRVRMEPGLSSACERTRRRRPSSRLAGKAIGSAGCSGQGRGEKRIARADLLEVEAMACRRGHSADKNAMRRRRERRSGALRLIAGLFSAYSPPLWPPA